MKCNICKRELDSPEDPTTKNCGGDCLRCMTLIGEDPDCIKYLDNITLYLNSKGALDFIKSLPPSTTERKGE